MNHHGFASPKNWNSSNNLCNNHPATGMAFPSASLNGQSLRKSAGHAGYISLGDPHHVQHLHESYDQKINAELLPGNVSQIRNCIHNSDGLEYLQDFERLYIETLLAQQKQYQTPMYQSSGLPHRYNGNLAPASTLLELKSSQNRPLELPDVLGHVIKFSMDQNGSRFIQQKLETASAEEKMKIFQEIMPHARNLMTDIFGNYVIQKHGTESHRKELASQFIGYVLSLSLQMYGCRVIQKALDDVDVDLQTQMVTELDGSVMKCIRDQNGNHVIQKCIECVPQDQIPFITSSIFGQVVDLSTHPYGCRVIQRVLEHCDDLKTQKIVMDEIMPSIRMLAQNQYGNYVIQHVLQHGKPHERSVIISKLAGQIVKMSQQKIASNVVEKWLTFGSTKQCQLLVNEMLGATDENGPLQAMMKDPFGNYVVQKVLEICDEQSREHILSSIKVHLTALKKYRYGKHIVSRVEKLITTDKKHTVSS